MVQYVGYRIELIREMELILQVTSPKGKQTRIFLSRAAIPTVNRFFKWAVG